MAKRKVKRKIKKILNIILILLLIIIIYVIFFCKNKVNIFIEVGEDIPKYLDSYVSKDVNKCKINTKKIDTSKSGNYSGYALCGITYYSISINIGDTTAPEINGVENLEVYLGEDINLTENITVKDNSGKSIIPSVEGTYDLDKEGIYKLSYKACDNLDNCIEEDFTLTVIEDNVVRPKYINGTLIVNKSYPLPEDYVPENLTKLSNGAQAVDYVKDAFEELVADAKEEGLNIYPSTAYRSIAFQSVLYNNYVARDGQEQADTYSARPGYSEHHTGLAIDVNDVNSSFDDTDEAKWLSDNCYKYGFILRYPKGSQDKTGYKYESWHIRYVGKDLAKEFYNDGTWITMEEYYNITSEYKD